MIRPFLLVPFAVLLAAAPAPNQGVPLPGMEMTLAYGRQGQVLLAGFDRLPGGDLVTLEGAEFYRHSPGGRQRLFSFPTGSFGAFVQATAVGVFLAESITGRLVRYDPGAGVFADLTRVNYPFDLAEAPDGALYLSADPGYGTSGAGNRIFHLDPATGALDEVVRLTGPSGPIAFDGQGDLYYAAQSSVYPTPPGVVKILRWRAAQVLTALGPGYLTDLDAGIVAEGLDEAYDLELDRFGRIYLTAPQRGGVFRIDPGLGTAQAIHLAKPLTGTGHTVLRLYDGGGPATFDPWQPAEGGGLLVAASDYLSFAQIEELKPRRGRLTGFPAPDIPPGEFRLNPEGGPAGGWAWCFFSPQALGGEVPLPLAGVRAPLLVGLWPHPMALVVPVALDGGGRGTLMVRYAGGGPLVFFCQAFLVDPIGGLVGTSGIWAGRFL